MNGKRQRQPFYVVASIKIKNHTFVNHDGMGMTAEGRGGGNDVSSIVFISIIINTSDKRNVLNSWVTIGH